MQGFNMGRYHPPDSPHYDPNHVTKRRKPNNHDPPAVQTIRFELPFPIWCSTCPTPTIIAEGTRFNASKQHVGAYHSTKIWEFRIKHAECAGQIVIRTDPARARYVVVSGGRQRAVVEGLDGLLDAERMGDGIGSNGEIGKETGEDGDGDDDAMGLVERKAADQEAAKALEGRLVELRDRSKRDWGDMYETSRRMRRGFRIERRKREEENRAGEALREKFGLGFDVSGSNEAEIDEDRVRARTIDFDTLRRSEGRADEGKFLGDRNVNLRDDDGDAAAAGRRRIDGTKRVAKVRDKDCNRAKSLLQSNLRRTTLARTGAFAVSGW